MRTPPALGHSTPHDIMQTTVKFDLLNFSEANLHLIMPIHIQGQRLHMIIDTGCTHTVLDKHLPLDFNAPHPIDEPSYGMGGHLDDLQIAPLQNIQIGRIVLESYEFVLANIADLNQVYREFLDYPIAGLLGSDLMEKLHATISYPRRCITFRLE